MFLPLQPNFASPMIERLEWLTDVQSSVNGTEVRRQLRQLPRSSLSFSFFLPGVHAQKFKNILRKWQGKVVQAPWWPGAICTDSEGDTQRPHVSGEGWPEDDFAVGEKAVYFKDFDSWEIVDVLEYSNSTFTLRTSTPSRAWPVGTKLVPVRDFYLSSSQGIDGITGSLSTGSVTLEQTAPYPAGYEVENVEFDPLNEQPDRTSAISEDWARLVEELDYHTGARYFDDYTDQPSISTAYEYLLTSKAKVSALRAWLHYEVMGRHLPFEMPTWQCDFQVVENPPDGILSNRFDVRNTGNSSLSVRPTKIRLAGTMQPNTPSPPPPAPWVAFPSVTGITVLNAETERVNISSLGSFTRFVIKQASWIYPTRLDSDSIEISHMSGSVSRVTLPMKTMRLA